MEVWNSSGNHLACDVGKVSNMRRFVAVVHERGDIHGYVRRDLAEHVVHANAVSTIRSVREPLSQDEDVHVSDQARSS
jgi:hypothetical protein